VKIPLVDFGEVCYTENIRNTNNKKQTGMSFFSGLFGKNVFLGVDVGTASIKAVELTYDGQKPVLSNYGYVSLRDAGIRMRSAPEIHKAIAALLKKMHTKANRIYVSLPSPNGLVALLEFPEMSEKELEQAIRFEAHKYIPADMEDVALSWEVIRQLQKNKERLLPQKQETLSENEPKGEEKEDSQEILLVAALKSDVSALSEHFKKAQYTIHAIELESFSLVRALTRENKGSALVVDIGHSICNFVLSHDGTVRISRNIDVGGKSITDTISDSMNLSSSRADDLKKGPEDLFHKKEMSITFAGLDVVSGEINRIIASYEKKHTDRRVEPIILSGGTSGMTGLREFFAEKTGRVVEVGNLWKNISYEKNLEPYISRMDGGFSVAIGLALRGVDDFRRGA
jgi:type IV pilus assembly protein PilM